MFKKLFKALSFGKKNEEPQVEVVEADEIIVPEPVKLPETIEEETITPETNGDTIGENITVHAETIKIDVEDLAISDRLEEIVELDSLPPIDQIETSLKYEVYIGNSEEDVELANIHDFSNLEEAREFALQYAQYKGKSVFFIHEQVELENGDKSFHRHY